MDAYFLNTETRARYTIRYINPKLNTGTYTVTYQSANVPQSTKNLVFWINTQNTQKSLSLYLDGENITKDVDLLKSFCVPGKGKKSPPVVQFKIANLPVSTVVLVGVSVEYDLNFQTNKKLSRGQLTIQYMEVS